MENKHSNLDEIAQPLVQRQQALELYVLSVIARRVKAIGEMLPSDIYKLSRLAERGADIKKIEKEVARITNLQVSDITQIIKEAAADNYLSLAKNHRLPPLKENKEIQKIIDAVAERTGDTYKNISKAQAFMFRNKKNRKEFVPTSISKAYDEVIDKAIQAVESGAVDYREAMRDSLKELTASGLRNVWYEAESGKLHTQRMDTAVRRNLMDGIREVSQSVMLQTGKQFWSDGVEITVHAYPAPDHAPIQGHMFANEEFNKMQAEQDFKDINGKQYGSIKRSIGIWNCTHFAFPIVIGVDVPTYTQEQLDEILKTNQKGYTFPDGKHLTMYECTQEQRRMETEIRYRKEWRKTAEEWVDKQEAERYKAEEKRLTNEYYAFSKACGLRPKYDRLRVEGEVPPKTTKPMTKSSYAEPVKNKSNTIESGVKSSDKTEIKNFTEVQDDYKKNATPGSGNVTYDEEYDFALHKKETAFAEWLHNYYGGNIKLLNEKNEDKIKTPDYIWNEKLWDLKTVTTEKSANYAVRKGLHQIEENPGGIFLDFGDNNISIDTLLDVIEKRMKWHKDMKSDIMIIQNSEVIKVLRYEKKS